MKEAKTTMMSVLRKIPGGQQKGFVRAPSLVDQGREYELDARIMASAMLMTKVPGIGGAFIHWPARFRTWRAWTPVCCRRMVKHLDEVGSDQRSARVGKGRH